MNNTKQNEIFYIEKITNVKQPNKYNFSFSIRQEKWTQMK